jgi:hypothetical protein
MPFGIEREFSTGLPKDNPGPGSYGGGVGVKTSQLPTLSRTERQPLWKEFVRITPPPGQYDPHRLEEKVERASKLRIENPAFKSKEARDSLVNREGNPGPGAYTVKLAKKNGKPGKIAEIPRFTENDFCGSVKLSDTPPPGQYGIPGDLYKVPGGVISNSQRIPKNKKREVTPGPVDYQDPRKAAFIYSSANPRFDPVRQPILKYDGV